MAFALHFAARSDIGLGRYKNNQDSGYAGPHLIAVADGMGGAAGGDIASSTVITELADLDIEGPGPDAHRDLVAAVVAANEAMHQHVDQDADLFGMGSTVTALLRSGNRFILAHVGDSRAYRLRGNEFQQVTHDHTFVQRLIDNGEITPEEAERHPQRSVILRVVGHMTPDDIDTSSQDAVIGERWLLCSDGLPRVVSDDTIRDTLAAGNDVGQTADQLIQLALRAGGPDNITVVVADVVDSMANPPLTPQVVGAAANTRDQPSQAVDTAASRAARLSATAAPEAIEDPELDPDLEPDRRRNPWITRSLALLAIAAVLLAGGIAARQWLNQQFFLGVQDGQVTMYRGLDSSLGPISVNSVEKRTNLKVSSIPPAYLPVEKLPSGSRATVEGQLSQLWHVSSQCPTSATPPAATPNPSAAPTTVPAQSAPTAGTSTIAPTTSKPAVSTPGSTATPTVTSTATATAWPSECDS